MDDLYKKLKFKARRGMLELDLILNNYLLNNYALMSSDLKQQFDKLMDLTDPELWDLLVVKSVKPERRLQEIVAAILD